MPFNLFLAVAAFMILWILILWLAFFLPVRRIQFAIKKSYNSLVKEWTIQRNYTFFLTDGYKLFSNKILKTRWELYMASVQRNKGRFEFANITEYFSPENMLKETTNTALASYIPAVAFFSGSILTAAAATLYLYEGLLTTKTISEAVLLVLGLAIASLFLSIYYKHITYKVQEELTIFTTWITQNHQSVPSITEELSDLRRTIGSYQYEQLKFYAKLSDHIARTTKTAIKPYLEDIQKTIGLFVDAAIEKQVESMQNLAEYFAKDTTMLYLDQIRKISETTESMADIQAKTAETLQSVTTIYTESKECIQMVGDTTGTVLSKYDTYMAQVEEMQVAVTATVKEMQELVEYIRTNSKNQNFTIENISRFQQEFLDTSAKSAASMQTFFDDFKDQYSSSLIALRAAAVEMAHSGETVRDSYTGLTEQVNQDVLQIFQTFEENLATISVHLSRSIRDLQEAIDELPDVLKQINRVEAE